MKANRLLLLTILLFSLVNGYSQNNAVHLSSGTIHPAANIHQAVIDSFNSHTIRLNNKAFAVIQFESIPSEQIKDRLSATGIELLEYIPDNAYTVGISGNLDLNILQMAKARAIFQLSSAQKMESRLRGN